MGFGHRVPPAIPRLKVFVVLLYQGLYLKSKAPLTASQTPHRYGVVLACAGEPHTVVGVRNRGDYARLTLQQHSVFPVFIERRYTNRHTLAASGAFNRTLKHRLHSHAIPPTSSHHKCINHTETRPRS